MTSALNNPQEVDMPWNKEIRTKQTTLPRFMHTHIYVRGSLNKFPDFFRMGTFIDSTHMKL